MNTPAEPPSPGARSNVATFNVATRSFDHFVGLHHHASCAEFAPPLDPLPASGCKRGEERGPRLSGYETRLSQAPDDLPRVGNVRRRMRKLPVTQPCRSPLRTVKQLEFIIELCYFIKY